MDACIGTPEKLVPQMTRLLSDGQGFWLMVTGYSMTPTLRHMKDRVYIEKFSGRIKNGEILLVKTGGNHCLLHRVVACDGDRFYLKGDAQSVREGPMLTDSVIGIVTKVDRRGRALSVNAFSRTISFAFRTMWWLRYVFPRKIGLRLRQ